MKYIVGFLGIILFWVFTFVFCMSIIGLFIVLDNNSWWNTLKVFENMLK
jgi:hypothetical protein